LDDYVNAADCYEQLTELHPDADDYRLYYAQALYKASLYDEAMKVSSQIDNPAYRIQVLWWHYGCDTHSRNLPET